jgi:hypothetical protein
MAKVKNGILVQQSPGQIGGKSGAPEEKVRQRVIAELRKLGWSEGQLRWKPEWPVPDTPHDLTKRERGQKYACCGSAGHFRVQGSRHRQGQGTVDALPEQ